MNYNNCPLCIAPLIREGDFIVCSSQPKYKNSIYWHYGVRLDKSKIELEFFNLLDGLNDAPIYFERNFHGFYIDLPPNFELINLGSNENWPIDRFNSPDKIKKIMMLL